jgi:hypothetical protein
MAYEDDKAWLLHVPFLLSFFCIFPYTFMGQGMTLRKKSDDLF